MSDVTVTLLDPSTELCLHPIPRTRRPVSIRDREHPVPGRTGLRAVPRPAVGARPLHEGRAGHVGIHPVGRRCMSIQCRNLQGVGKLPEDPWPPNGRRES